MSQKYLVINWFEKKVKNNFERIDHGLNEVLIETGTKIKLNLLDNESFIKQIDEDYVVIYVSGKGDKQLKVNETLLVTYKDGYQVCGDWVDRVLSYELKLIDRKLENAESSLSAFQIENNVLIKVNSSKDKIIVPEGVEEIGNGTFYKSLVKEVVLPKSLKKIDMNAFIYCKALKHIIIPSSVEEIGSFAFAFSGVEEVEIPSMTKKIGSYAFMGTKFIDKFNNNEFIILGDGVLYMYNGKKSEVIVPERVKYICPLAFYTTSYYNSFISKIVLPETVEIIYEKAFANLKSLKEININSNMKIHKEAFKGSLYEDKFKEFLKKNGE